MDATGCRFIRLLVLWLGVLCAGGTVRADNSNTVTLNLTGLIIQGELNQFRSSLPFHISAAPAYAYSITGNVHGVGPLYSLLVPTSEPVSTAFEAIHQGLSNSLQGTVPDPGSAFSTTILNQTVTSGTDGDFTATFQLSLEDTGLVDFGLVDVGLAIAGQPDTTDQLVFDSGSVTVTALSQDVSVATLTATNVEVTSATLRASIFCPNNFQAYFVFGTGTSFSSTTGALSLLASSTAQTVLIPVAGLLPHTLYHYKAVGVDVTGPSMGAVLTFKTADTAPVAGTVTAFAGTAPLAIPVLAQSSDADGDALKVTAVGKPFVGKATVQKGGAGVTYQFTTNAAAGDTFTYTVADAFGMSGTGQVKVTSYAPLAGTYSTVMLDVNGTGAGYMRATLSPAGKCTGTVLIAGVSYTFSGQVDSAGQFTETIKSAAAPFGVVVTLAVAPSPGAGGFTLSAGVTMNGINLAGAMTLDVLGNAAGLYTMVIPPPVGAGYVGSGYATVNINTAGLAAITGALPDGVAFTCASEINKSGEMALFSPLYATANRGGLAGILSVSGPGNAVLTGSLVWTKPALASAGIDQGPFSMVLTGSGGRYVNAAPVLKLGANGSSGKTVLSGGNLNSVLSRNTSVSQNKVTVFGTPAITVTITPATGVFTGKFVDTLTGQTRQLHGVIVQGTSGSAAGYFLGDSEGGGVDVGP